MLSTALSAIARFPKTAVLIAGALSALAMAPFFIWPLLALGVCVFVVAAASAPTPRAGGLVGFCFGMGYFTAGLHWIPNALVVDNPAFVWLVPPAMVGLPALLSLCWFAAGWFTVRFSQRGTLARSVLLLAMLAVAEYGRAFFLSGFPWNLFGYVWGFSPAMMQGAALGGIYGLTGFTIFWMATPALVWQSFSHPKIMKPLLLAAAISVTAAYGYGTLRLAANPPALRDDFAVLIVQPSIPQRDKWDGGKAVAHFMKHVRIGARAMADYTPPPGLKSLAVLWPETSLDGALLDQAPEAAQTLARMMSGHPYRVALVSGLWRRDGQDRYYNSIGAFSVDGDGRLRLDSVYDKHHLVPFGEYLPLEDTLHLTPLVGFAGFQRGPGPRVLQSPATPPFTPLVCFESIFPWYAASGGADWIANVSNDGWYGDTPGPYQHLVMTRFRAIEQGKPLARAASTGISALIDPYGRVVARLGYDVSGSVLSRVPSPTLHRTPYDRMGNTLYFLTILGAIGFFVFFQKTKV